ILLLPI
ncbi:hypothetical protein PENANT_c343G09036, partial [Penicillium antarcticum]